MGYYRAGFTQIVGVDKVNQPRYPFEFVQADALEYAVEHGAKFDALHGSPPCQFHNSLSVVNGRKHGSQYLNLIPQTRKVMQSLGKPYVIENVVGARRHLITPLLLCGTFFGLKVYRHRLFECNPFILSPFIHQPHDDQSPGCNGNRVSPKGYVTVCGGKGGGFRLSDASEGMGIDWMTRAELAQAIPPAYTEWIGTQMIKFLKEPA